MLAVEDKIERNLEIGGSIFELFSSKHNSYPGLAAF